MQKVFLPLEEGVLQYLTTTTKITPSKKKRDQNLNSYETLAVSIAEIIFFKIVLLL